MASLEQQRDVEKEYPNTDFVAIAAFGRCY
jgi:hypothetical protein